ncbi:hypothetical protein YS110_09770 [Acidovorax sp. YS12]|nr:hypothetical protein YS110_09770 [Acidovorax sp. YS12]
MTAETETCHKKVNKTDDCCTFLTRHSVNAADAMALERLFLLSTTSQIRLGAA